MGLQLPPNPEEALGEGKETEETLFSPKTNSVFS